MASCGGEGGASDNPAASPSPATSPTPEAPDLTIFHNWAYPIAGACLPKSDNLMPNASRDYRGGTHEGVDFYAVDNCTAIEKNTPALAAKPGRIIRADHDYTDLTPEQLQRANDRIAAGDANAFEVLDLFRGRQVWIDHGKGIVTRYAHLEGIPEAIVVGVQVETGDVVGFVGDSGTPESISAPDTEIHLHWEFRVGDSYLGAGMPPEDVRALYESLFEPVPDNATFE